MEQARLGFSMRASALWSCTWLALGLAAGTCAIAQNPNTDQIDTLHTTTQLVVLDATVIDKQGHIVTTPLTRDDFEVQEDRRPQVIRYFESAAEHDAEIRRGTPDAAPLLIAVLDEVNFHYDHRTSNADNTQRQFNDYHYERSELVGYLAAQPARLNEPVEVLALTHHGYLIVAQPTRDRDQVIERVKRRDPGLGSPFRDDLEEYFYGDLTLTKISLEAMWSLALQERGVPGRKIVLWLGYGGPESQVTPSFGRPKRLTPGDLYFREVTDLLVDGRVTLDLFPPGLNSGQPEENPLLGMSVVMSTPNSVGFLGYAEATGGVVDHGNDVDGELTQAVNSSVAYYTISYAPQNHDFDAQFRRIRITVQNHPEWTVLTKAGYYGLQDGGQKVFEHELQTDLSIATFESMPFSAVGTTIQQVERIQDTEERGGFTARFVLDLDPDDLEWHTNPQTSIREADVAVSAAALGKATTANALASRAGTWRLTAKVLNPDERAKTTVTLELHLPAKTQRVRFVVRDISNGRMGTTDVGMKAVETAPEVQQTQPNLRSRPAGQ
jgi:VWFA-related protein